MKDTDMTMMREPLIDTVHAFAPDAMRALHAMIRRELALIPDLVRAVAAGDSQRAGLVADHIALVGGVLERHCQGEDRHVWPRLRERCPGRWAPVADVVGGLRDAALACLRQVEQAAGAWRDGASAQARGVLAGAVGRLIEVTTEQLTVVQDRVVPLVGEYISDAEYAAKDRECAASVPRDKLPLLFGMFMFDGETGVIGMFVADMPVEVGPVIMDLSVRAYAAHANELYGMTAPAGVTGPTPSQVGSN